ncbi:hypothetical protein BCR44DRAFT_1187506 [Catenaria anguillulae PL171]|uniref:Uncharacterized protein n=1 Tax=Catenaria anguillulae PL171 TaxID=765915 RepID=A0A1Y2H587_9FUNG|nr:hypothetical protein BCR44DRAFT_1187506 [Catenaria anguillulae PL171]
MGMWLKQRKGKQLRDGSLKSCTKMPTSKELTVDLFNVLVSRGFVESVPAFFAAVQNLFTAPMLDVYVRAMSSPGLWSAIQPPFIASIIQHDGWYSYCLDLLLVAISNGSVAETTLRKCLIDITSFSIPASDMSRMGSKLPQLFRVPFLWQTIRLHAMNSLAQPGHAFAAGLQLVFDMMFNGAAENDTRAVFSALLSKPLVADDVEQLLASPAVLESLVKMPAVWTIVYPLLKRVLADDTVSFSLGLQFVLGVLVPAPGASAEALHLTLRKPISPADLHGGLTSPESPFRRALSVLQVWRWISPRVISCFNQLQDGFEPGLAFVLFAAQRQVPEQEWAAMLAAVAAQPVATDVLQRLLTDGNSLLDRATEHTNVWQAITPSLCATFPSLPDGLSAGVDFILKFVYRSRQSLESCTTILSAMSQVPPPVSVVSELAGKLVSIMQVSTVDFWTPIAVTIQHALHNQDGSYAAGLQVIRGAKDAGVHVTKWAQIVPSTFSRVPIPTRETLCDWSTQSTLWRCMDSS